MWAEIAGRFTSLYEELLTPLAASRLRWAARLTGRLTPQVDESLTDLAELAEDLERDGQAVLALPANPLVVEPFDGVVERPRRLAAASWGEQRVKDGLGPVSAQGDRVGGVLDQPKLDRVGKSPSSNGSFGARLVHRLHPQVLRHQRRCLLV